MKKMNTLQTYFQADNNILLVYLFGSRVTGKIGPTSDYDIGVLFKKSIPFNRQYFLERQIKRNRSALRKTEKRFAEIRIL